MRSRLEPIGVGLATAMAVYAAFRMIGAGSYTAVIYSVASGLAFFGLRRLFDGSYASIKIIGLLAALILLDELFSIGLDLLAHEAHNFPHQSWAVPLVLAYVLLSDYGLAKRLGLQRRVSVTS